MTGLTPATAYSFSVGGVAASGAIDGLGQVIRAHHLAPIRWTHHAHRDEPHLFASLLDL